MVMATMDAFDHLGPESYQPIPGFPPMEMRNMDHVVEKTDGKAMAVALRAVPGVKWVGSPWHMHHLDFQLVWCISGTMDFDFEGVGEIHLGPGTVIYQPPENRHRELGVSQDNESLLLTIPPKFKSTMFLYDEQAGGYSELVVDTDDAEAAELNKVEYEDA